MNCFCGTPILWIHPDNPAALVLSSNTTVPLSTNPPAVIGRFSASYCGADCTPDAIPLLMPGFCGGGEPEGAWELVLRLAISKTNAQQIRRSEEHTSELQSQSN